MIFQLAEEFYKKPNLYNNLLEHLVIMGSNSGPALGKQFDFQFTYEHNARPTAASNPDYQYVDLAEELNFSDPAKDDYYRHHAVVVLPGLGTPRSARTIAVPGARLHPVKYDEGKGRFLCGTPFEEQQKTCACADFRAVTRCRKLWNGWMRRPGP
jgi:hypothetical protein